MEKLKCNVKEGEEQLVDLVRSNYLENLVKNNNNKKGPKKIQKLLNICNFYSKHNILFVALEEENYYVIDYILKIANYEDREKIMETIDDFIDEFTSIPFVSYDLDIDSTKTHNLSFKLYKHLYDKNLLTDDIIKRIFIKF